MDRQEVISIMAVLKTAYPNFYRNMSREDARSAVDLWLDMFAGDPAPLVGAAVKALIATDEKGYPPHIGAVKAKLRQLTAPVRDTEAEAWSRVRRAVSRGIYHAEEGFNSLPPEIRQIVGSPEQIREWALMDADTVSSVVASNFQRSYRARAAQREQWDALPAGVKELARSLGAGLPALDQPAGVRGTGCALDRTGGPAPPASG